MRFVRAVAGTADPSAPDIDDHGYTICPGGPTQGPSVGVASGALMRVKVMRDRMGDDADLFVTMADASVAAIEFPPVGTALPAADIPADDTNVARPADCVFLRGGAEPAYWRRQPVVVVLDHDKGIVGTSNDLVSRGYSIVSSSGRYQVLRRLPPAQ